MSRAALFLLGWLLAAPILATAAPQRIVSLDYCADQYVLALADRDQIAALSRGAMRDDSYFRARGVGLPLVRDSLEAVIGARPDLVVRNWGGGVHAADIYARFGIPVLQVGDAATFAVARDDLIAAASAIGQPARGQALAADLDHRLVALRAGWRENRPRVLYLSASGAVAGRGGLLNAVLEAAGGANVRAAAQWDVLPLERLVGRPPAIVALGFFDSGQTRASPWTLVRHPALRQALRDARVVSLPADLISCEAWYAIGAAERLAAAMRAP